MYRRPRWLLNKVVLADVANTNTMANTMRGLLRSARDPKWRLKFRLDSKSKPSAIGPMRCWRISGLSLGNFKSSVSKVNAACMFISTPCEDFYNMTQRQPAVGSSSPSLLFVPLPVFASSSSTTSCGLTVIWTTFGFSV
jgi:hypothetical protein